MDDLVSGKRTVAQAQEMKKNVIEIFDDAKFTLHRWHSNNRELEDISSSDGEITFAKQQLGASSQGDGSLLGITWSKEEDNIKVCVPSSEVTITKSGILSKIIQSSSAIEEIWQLISFSRCNVCFPRKRR